MRIMPFLAGILATLFVLGVACNSTIKDKPFVNMGQKPLGRVDARLQVIQTNSANKDLVEQQAGEGRKDLEVADQEISSDIATKQKVIDEQFEKIHRQDLRYENLDAKWYVRWGKEIEFWFRFWIIAVIISVVIRYIGVFLTGRVGMIFAWVGTGALNLLFCFVPLLTGVADNVYFRWFKKNENPNSEKP